jgi:molybdenum cofactor cytidylyltransferase
VITAIVLAAGASKRLGHPKQLVEIGGETLLECAVRTAQVAGCAPVVVVLGSCAEQILKRCNLSDAIAVVNLAWEEGMASSIRAGMAAASGAEGVVLMTCDQPAVTAAHLRALMATRSLAASAYAGRRGVPAYFPAALFAKLLALSGDAGARDLLREAAAVDLRGGELDVDTVADLNEAKLLFG